MSFAAIGASLAGAVVSAGLAYAMRPSMPDSPDAARSSRDAVLADLRTLPGRRQVEALARLGQRGEYLTGTARFYVPNNLTEEQRRGLAALSLRPGEQVEGRQLEVLARLGITPRRVGETRTADFTGLGDAEVEGRLARAMAENELELSRKYGAEFIDLAREQGELADPEGAAARRLLASEIDRMARTERARPVSAALEGQMVEDLSAGRGLTADVADQVAAVQRRRAGAGDAASVDLANELETGVTGENRLRDRLGHAMAHLSSGQTPEDQRYRDEQQAMANMAAFLSGRTPQSQFGANRGAQAGATLNAPMAPLPGQNPQGAALFQGADLTSFQQGAAAQRGQVSPWFAGLNTLLRGAQVAGSAGWQPFAQKT